MEGGLRCGHLTPVGIGARSNQRHPRRDAQPADVHVSGLVADRAEHEVKPLDEVDAEASVPHVRVPRPYLDGGSKAAHVRRCHFRLASSDMLLAEDEPLVAVLGLDRTHVNLRQRECKYVGGYSRAVVCTGRNWDAPHRHV
jgi:hypothetical protein